MPAHIRPSAFSGGQLTSSQDNALLHLHELALVVFKNTPMPMVVTDPKLHDQPIILANRAFSELTGYSSSEIIGRNCRFLQGEDTKEFAVTTLRAALEQDDDMVEVELLNYRKDGTTFMNALQINAVRDAHGNLLYHFATQKDVTSVHRSQELEASERRLLMEVDHRTMNVLALIQSIVNLSQARDAQSLSQAINGRIASLARTHRLLAERRWGPVKVIELINTQITASNSNARIAIEGEDAELRVNVAQPIALIIHELFSNAQVHGALSGKQGLVSVKWSIENDMLVLTWREEVPQLKHPVLKEGFGLQIVRTVVEQQLGGRPNVRIDKNGLEATFVIPKAVACAA